MHSCKYALIFFILFLQSSSILSVSQSKVFRRQDIPLRLIRPDLLVIPTNSFPYLIYTLFQHFTYLHCISQNAGTSRSKTGRRAPDGPTLSAAL